MMRAVPRGRPLLAALVAVAIAACGQRVDVADLTRSHGLDGAAAELRFRLASAPRDPTLLIALAEIEEARGRPGAALEALDRAERLGRPFRGGLGGAARRRLAALLVARAAVRADRGSADAEADLRRARGLDAAIDPALAQRAAIAAIAADLRRSDPDRRAAGVARLRSIDPTRAAGLGPDASTAAIDATTAWLVEVGARRVAFETLDGAVERALAARRVVDWPAVTVERWLTLRRWWSGQGDPIDRPTLDRARAIGASTCAYADGPTDPGCDVIAAAASAEAPRWEPALIVAWQRGGWRAADAERAHAWAIVAARAVARGQLLSWSRAIADHVEPALVAALTPPIESAPAVPDGAAVLAAVGGDDPQLVAVVDGFARDPALADRRAEDVAARAIDVATAGPALARVFTALGDPARARAWWQRGFDASRDDPAIALGLAIAMADAADPPAGLQLAMRAAAASGDASTTLVVAARGFAAAGQTLDAIGLARQAIELSAPGDEDAAAAVAAMLLAQLGRARAAAEVGALATLPSAWDFTALDAEAARVAAALAAPDRRAAAVARALQLARSADPAAAAVGAATLRTIARQSAAAGRGSELR